MSHFNPNQCYSSEDMSGNNSCDDMLYAFYDLAVSPATFDIVHFLGLADESRRILGLLSFHLVIVPGPDDGFRKDRVTPYGNKEKMWRLTQVLLPICSVFTHFSGVSLLKTRVEASIIEQNARFIFPKGYSIQNPKENYRLRHMVTSKNLKGIEASTIAMGSIDSWFKQNTRGRKVITITLREASFEKDRNSNLLEWGKFATSLNQNIFFPVFIRDFETAFDKVPDVLKGMSFFSDVIFNIELRCALYQLSYLNLFVNNGPAALSRLNEKSRSLTFKMIVPSSYATSTPFFIESGLNPGDQLSSVSPFHRFIWNDDHSDIITQEFETMCQQIDSSFLG